MTNAFPSLRNFTTLDEALREPTGQRLRRLEAQSAHVTDGLMRLMAVLHAKGAISDTDVETVFGDEHRVDLSRTRR